MSQRLNPDRYKVHGDWEHVSNTEWGRVPDGVTYQIADLLEVRSGHIWHAGAHKVTLDKATRETTGMKSTTFYGESAWSDANRYIDDVYYKLRRNG